MANTSKIQFLILCASLCCHNSAWAVDYVISQNNNLIDGGIAFGPGDPIILQLGDTLTVKNNRQVSFNPNPDLAATPNPDPNLPPSIAPSSSMIIAYGNNTITIESGSSFMAPQNSSPTVRNTNLISFLGNGNSTIIVEDGATLQSADPAASTTENLNLFSVGNERITVKNLGTLVGTGYFNNINSDTSTLILLGAATVQNTMNYNSEITKIGASTLWVGGFIDKNAQINLTTTNYIANADYHPFRNVRIFAASSMTLNAKSYLGAVLTENFVIDDKATFTLTGAPSGGVAQLTLGVNNLQNNGTLVVANNFVNGNIRTIEVNTLDNAGAISIFNNSSIIGESQNSSKINNNVGGAITVTSGKISQFDSINNSGALTVSGTLADINTFNNNNKGDVIFMNGSTIANLGKLNNGAGSSFKLNGANFADVNGNPNYQTFSVANDGAFIISNGNIGILTLRNSGTVEVSGGNIAGFNNIDSLIYNGPNGEMTFGVGSTVTQIHDFQNYGKLNLAGVVTDTSIINLDNYGVINHSVGSMNATNLNNNPGATYNLTGSASIIPYDNYMLNQGKIVADTTGTITASFINGDPDSNNNATLEIKKLALIYNISNDDILKITGPVTFTPQAAIVPSIENTGQLELNNANITVTTNTQNPIFNGAVGIVNTTGPVTFNFPAPAADISTGVGRYCNFTNEGRLYLNAPNGTINYTNSGTNVFFTSSIGLVNVKQTTTLTCSSAVPGSTITYANYGMHYTYINSVEDPSTLIVEGPADLANCSLKFDVNPVLIGKHTFKILSCAGIINPPATSSSVDTFLLKKSISHNNSMIFVDYERKSLADKSFNLSDNALSFATALEQLLFKKQFQDESLNQLYEKIYTSVDSAEELEKFLTKKLPIGSVPIQNSVVQQSVVSQIDSRMQAIRVAYNSADYTTGLSPWIKYFSTTNRQGAMKNNVGYKFRSDGLVFGMDNYDGVGTQYGASFTIARSTLDQHTSLPSRSKTNVFQVNFYSQNIRPSNYYTDWVIGGAYSTIDQIRVDVENDDKVAYARYSWQQFSGKYEFGRIFDINREYYFVPYVSGHYTFLKNYRYREYSDEPSNYYIISPAKHVVEAGIGIKSSTHLFLFNKNFIPKFTLGAKYSITSPMYTLNASIIDQDIVFQVNTKVPRLKYYGGLGATLEIIDNLDLSANFEAEVYQKYLGLSYNFILRYLF